MKIGAFAEYFDLNKSTIRYYTDINLLMPQKTDTYPEYNESCLNDMKDILALREMGFTIEEIQAIKSYERFNLCLFNSNNTFFNQVINSKISELEDKIQQIESQISSIKKYHAFQIPETFKKALGLPLNTLSVLQCPYCNSTFSITEASIDNNMIHSGSLQCECDQAYIIENGIITTTRFEEIVAPQFLVDRTKSLDYQLKFNNDQISLYRVTGSLLCQYFESWDHRKGILFPNADIDILLMQLDRFFQEDGIYIFSSYDSHSLILLKEKMEVEEIKGSFIFIYTEGLIPLSKSVHYMIDNCGNLYDLIAEKEAGSSVQRLAVLPSEDSEWLYIHLGLDNPNDICKDLEYTIPYVLEETCLDHYESINMIQKEVQNIGDYNNIDNIFEVLHGQNSLAMKLFTLEHKDKASIE